MLGLSLKVLDQNCLVRFEVSLSNAVDLRGCLPPFSLINFLVSLSNALQLSLRPLLGPHGVRQDKQGELVCCLTLLASDRGLVQIFESLCKYVFAAAVNANFSSSITDSLRLRNLYLVPVLSFSTRVVSSNLRFAACSTCLPFLT